MFVNFENLANSSKVWVYQSNREFTSNEIEKKEKKIKVFIGSWKRHGDDLKASYQIKYNQFIILAVDEEYNGVSGCSIDASANLFKQIESLYNVDLFNKFNVAFKDGEIINVVSLPDFQKYVEQQKINAKTTVFNNLVKTKKELDTNWEVAADESWHSRYFN